jgi:predicted ribosome quality control (RQC) complex YloA/Tae2 family protein
MNNNLTTSVSEYETFQEAYDKMINNTTTSNNSQTGTFNFTYPDLTPEEVQTLQDIEDTIIQQMREEQAIEEADQNVHDHQMYEESCDEYNAWQLEQTIECDMDDSERRHYKRSRKQRIQKENYGYVLK